ncbi:MAG: glycosyltransferase family 4 protein [Solirubrobacterales bacterium]
MTAQRARPSEVWILDDGIIMGGGQRFALRLAGVMRDEGLDVGFVAPTDCRLAAEAAGAGFPTRDVRYPRLVPPAFWAMPRTVTRLRRVLADLPPDALVIGNTARCQGYAAAALVTLRRRPLFVHLMQEQDSAYRHTARAVYRRIGALVAVGENAARTYRHHLPDVPVTRINNFLPRADMEAMARERTAPPNGPRPVLGVLARMIPEKGVLELVDELAAIPDAWERLLVGAPLQDRRYTEVVRDRIAHHRLGDRIELLGEVHGLAPFFAQIDALVVPSTGNEGQPTVIIEGMLYGRPVIVRELLWSDDFAGLPLRRYRTAADLAGALAQPPAEPAGVALLAERFGGAELVTRLMAAAREAAHEERPDQLARPIGGRRPGGYEWTRHLMRHRTVTRCGSPVPTLSSYPVFVAGLPRTLTRRGPHFEFAGETYRYLYHRYNNTWMNERAVEVPIAGQAIAARPTADVLEIGNVLPHYLRSGHEVVDKYEHGSGVRNIDVLDLEPDRRWDLIVSISTLEHVGVDDAPHDPARGAAAARLLASRLAPGGELLLTVPVGYNPELDRALIDGALPGMELRALRRTAPGPNWAEDAPSAVLGLGYDWRNSSARAVLIGRLRAPAEPR